VLLADSSAWVRALRLKLNLATAMGDDIASCPAVHQEILRGAAGEAEFRRLQRTLALAEMLDDPVPLVRFEEAARLYIACRDKGFTIRSSHDCLIAAIAIAHDVPVLHDDRDFEHIAAVLPLRTIRL
jgi:predicted nucleic acid-binding protein